MGHFHLNLFSSGFISNIQRFFFSYITNIFDPDDAGLVTSINKNLMENFQQL